MKKVFILFATVALFASCTSSPSTEETVTTTDSTTVDTTVVDTTSTTTIINNISDSLKNGNIKHDTVSK